MNLNCLITGVGGQGTVLLARLIGNAAISAGFGVLGSETIGMAQRGGSVVSHIRMGDCLNSPIIPRGRADVIIAFEPAEAVRTLPLLAGTGRLLTLNRGIRPVSSSLGMTAPGKVSTDTAPPPYDPRKMIAYLESVLGNRAAVIDEETLAARCGSPRVINVALLGAALAKNILPISTEDVIKAIRIVLPSRFWELNEKALIAGKGVIHGNE
jgi:indolepyruvate ferredoxin oxidoreductase beta subunit